MIRSSSPDVPRSGSKWMALAPALALMVAAAPVRAAEVVPADVIVEALLPFISDDPRGFGTDRSPTEESGPTLGEEIRNRSGELTAEQTARLSQSIQEGALPAFDLALGFESDSTAITDAIVPALDQVGLALGDDLLSQNLFVLAGLASAGDSASMGQALAIGRSQAVRDYIVRKFDIDPSRIVAVGDLSRSPPRSSATLRIVNLTTP